MKKLPPSECDAFLTLLQARFEKNKNRHKNVGWNEIEAKLKTHEEKLWSLYEMERTGGEPDMIGDKNEKGEYMFYDCSPESPKERRSLCYDRKALDARKENKPKNSVADMAAAMGIELLNE